jgi:hypothetical protein
MALASLVSVFGLGSGALLQACSSDATSGRRVVLHTRFELEPSVVSGFTTGVGWNVTLSKALLATGPFYYFDGVPPLVLNQPRHGWEYAARWLGLGIAHAHPGHYQAGSALGQMLEPSSLDVLGGAVDLADGAGISGTYRSASFSFSSPPVGPLASELAGRAAVVAGTAQKDGEEPRIFLASASLADIEKSAAKGQVQGCELTEVDVEADGTVTVVVNPRIWLNLVDFTAIDPGSAHAPSSFPDDSQPKIAFAQGLAQLSAYKFSYSNP